MAAKLGAQSVVAIEAAPAFKSKVPAIQLFFKKQCGNAGCFVCRNHSKGQQCF